MNEFFRKNILKGFYFSLGIHFLLILFFFVVQSISKEEGTTDAVVRILKYSELGPPPSISLENSEVAKGRLAKKEKFAVPKPVKKIQKDTVEIAKQTLSGSKEGEGGGLGVGDVKIISEETVKESRQVGTKPETKYYAAVDYMPEPKGGYGAIQSRVVIPEPAKQNNVSGKVLVKTYIDEMGKVVRTEIIQGIGYGCDDAAMRAVRNTRFSPGKLGGQYVRVQMIITVFF
ncbi:MAG: TonB family protein [Ignavibacteriaceae bacterium]|nr:TonB family protein [Ignavibacteriaceae bacterium]